MKITRPQKKVKSRKLKRNFVLVFPISTSLLLISWKCRALLRIKLIYSIHVILFIIKNTSITSFKNILAFLLIIYVVIDLVNIYQYAKSKYYFLSNKNKLIIWTKKSRTFILIFCKDIYLLLISWKPRFIKHYMFLFKFMLVYSIKQNYISLLIQKKYYNIFTYLTLEDLFIRKETIKISWEKELTFVEYQSPAVLKYAKILFIYIKNHFLNLKQLIASIKIDMLLFHKTSSVPRRKQLIFSRVEKLNAINDIEDIFKKAKKTYNHISLKDFYKEKYLAVYLTFRFYFKITPVKKELLYLDAYTFFSHYL
uniref:ORF-309 n=1 Tax=Physarum polycephalum TaxID=5791 RepID=Q35598_PHYPO|nr:unassigned reading frame [Physarum polycephalum]BAA06120.1 ORF-309 [Physarum polycephalum]